MSRIRLAKIDNKSDVVVNREVAAWRELASNVVDSYNYLFDDKNGKRHPVLSKIKNLVDNPLKNSRIELKKWHELYLSLCPKLRAIRRDACVKGHELLDQAKNLYNGKYTGVDKTTLYLKVGFEVSHPKYIEILKTGNYKVTIEAVDPDITIVKIDEPKISRYNW